MMKSDDPDLLRKILDSSNKNFDDEDLKQYLLYLMGQATPQQFLNEKLLNKVSDI
ncbi:MAG: hypothetical protein J0H68_08320 [Sphingobacteriia bacterium]|nr:hypothetical protein [Sphingobacteriia bacterium]